MTGAAGRGARAFMWDDCRLPLQAVEFMTVACVPDAITEWGQSNDISSLQWILTKARQLCEIGACTLKRCAWEHACYTRNGRSDADMAAHAAFAISARHLAE